MEAKRILIVDDEPHLVKLVKLRLEANGYEVATALNGLEGLKEAEENHPDLIIVDVMMPKMDGYTFVKNIRVRDELKAIPIIVLTVKNKLENLFKAEGVKDYIVKPFDAENLLEKVKKYT